jgi:hypothetical protein
VRGRDAEWPSRAACIGGQEGRQAPRLAMAAATQCRRRQEVKCRVMNDVPSTSCLAAVEAVLLPAMLCRCIARCPAVQGRPWRPQAEARAQGPAVHGERCCFLTICCCWTLPLCGSSHCAMCSAPNQRSSSVKQVPFCPPIPACNASCSSHLVLNPPHLAPCFPQSVCLLHTPQANMGHDTNTAHFSIMMGPAPHLNGDYTIFGGWTHCPGCACMNGVRAARWRCVRKRD